MYKTELEYQRIPGIESKAGRPVYYLLSPLVYDTDEITVTVPVGFETDFASIPEWIFFLNPKNGKWRKASVVHDYLLKTGKISVIRADNIFFKAMLDDEASLFTAYVLWIAVRLNHLFKGKR
jgi:hypothetical protein